MPSLSRISGSDQSDSSARKREIIRKLAAAPGGGGGGGGGTPTITVSSSSFTDGGITIPTSQIDSTTNPPLQWSASDTTGIATWSLRYSHEEAPGGGYLHWSINNIPVGTTSIAAGGSWPEGTVINPPEAGTFNATTGWQAAGPGNYEITIRAHDNLGNIIASGSIGATTEGFTRLIVNPTTPIAATLTSTTFVNAGNLPPRVRFNSGECGGVVGQENTSPQLTWNTNARGNIATLRLECIDISAGNFIHWFVQNIPLSSPTATTLSIAENGSWPAGSTIQGTSWSPTPVRANGWGGTCGQPTNVYRFTMSSYDSEGRRIAGSNAVIFGLMGT